MKINMNFNLKHSLILAGIGALLFGGFNLIPASADAWGHDVRQDRNDLRGDRQDARRDVRDLRKDHTEVRHLDSRLENQVAHDRFGAALHTEARIGSERRDMGRDKRDLKFDRRDVRQDKRDLRRDW